MDIIQIFNQILANFPCQIHYLILKESEDIAQEINDCLEKRL